MTIKTDIVFAATFNALHEVYEQRANGQVHVRAEVLRDGGDSVEVRAISTLDILQPGTRVMIMASPTGEGYMVGYIVHPSKRLVALAFPSSHYISQMVREN